MDLKDLQRHLDQVMEEQNNRPLPEFEGYSPLEMYKILYDTFAIDSPIKLQKLSDPDYQKVPILNQVKFLLNLIDQNGELKLTKKGFLPTKVVADIYQQGFLKEKHIESGISRHTTIF